MNNKMMKIAKKVVRWIKRHIYLIPVVLGSIFVYVSFAAFASFENDPSNKNSIIEKSLATTNQIEITETTSTTNTIVTTTRTTTSTTTDTTTTTTEITTTSTVIETEEVTIAAIVEETTEAYVELQTEVVDTTNSNYDENINNSSDSEVVIEDTTTGNETLIGTFSRGTYYCGYEGTYGGSGRTLQSGYSIASRAIYEWYGYGDYKVRIECDEYPELNGIYSLDDCSAPGNYNVIDFYYNYNSVPNYFYQCGVLTVRAYIVY